MAECHLDDIGNMTTLKEYCEYSFKLENLYNNFSLKNIDELFYVIHSIKGLSLGTDNSFLASKLHLFEEQILELQAGKKVGLDEFKRKFFTINQLVKNNLSISSENFPDYLKVFVNNISKVSKKKVTFIIDSDSLDLNAKEIGVLKDIVNPLLINALDHGIETEAERINLGKSAKGKIFFQLKNTSREISILIKDDGCGINLKARLPENTMLSGRKVGLRLVEWQLLEYNGSIDIQNNIGRGTKISIVLPRIHRQQEAA